MSIDPSHPILQEDCIFRIGRTNVFASRLLWFCTVFSGMIALVNHSVWAMLGALTLPLFVFVHEISHFFASRLAGLHVFSMHINVFGGITETSGYLRGTAWREILIASSGPIANLLIYVIISVILHFFLTDSATALHSFLEPVLWINLILFLLNLLPVFPFDGGRIACVACVSMYGETDGFRYTRYLTTAGLILLCLLGMYMIANKNYSGFFLILIAFLLFRGDLQSMYMHKYSEAWIHTVDKGFLAGRREKRLAERRASRKAECLKLSEQIDGLLDKVSKDGLHSLTSDERKLLERSREIYKELDSLR